MFARSVTWKFWYICSGTSFPLMAAILFKVATALSVSPLVTSQLADSNTNLLVLELQDIVFVES